ncbi:hypothetical protein BHM03_00018259, partial [Ensete ventricosum]
AILSSSRAIRDMIKRWLVEVGLSPAPHEVVAAAKRRAVEFQVETERKRVELEEVFRQQEVLEKELNESGFLLSNTQ